MLEAAGLATAAAVWVASMKGVAQFGGRVVEISFARNLRAITVARIAVGVLPPSLLLLLAGTGSLPLIVAFTLLMGASQGVITIVRGAVPLVLFGAKGYGAVLGVIATPILIVNAASPTVFAWIVDRWGWATGRVSLLVGCSAAWLAMELMSRWYERRRAARRRRDRFSPSAIISWHRAPRCASAGPLYLAPRSSGVMVLRSAGNRRWAAGSSRTARGNPEGSI